MAPASASPQPPPGRSDTTRSEEPGPQQTGERHEAYGPLDIKRRVKDDGRGLILYTRGERDGE